MQFPNNKEIIEDFVDHSYIKNVVLSLRRVQEMCR
jgi:hypothetical protein